MTKIAIFSSNNPEDACGYLRFQAPLETNGDCLAGYWGVRWERSFLFRRTVIDESLIDAADIIVVQRLFPRRNTRKVLEKALASGKPVVFEIDDLLMELPADHPYRRNIADKIPYIIDFMRRATALTVTTAPLKEALRGYNGNIHVLPNLLDERLWNRERPEGTGQVVIGFGGTKSHLHDLQIIEKPLAYIADKYRGAVSFRFWGCTSNALMKIPGLEFLKFTSSYRTYAEQLQSTAIDIAVVPLQDNRFNRCKSNIKWLEYSAGGTAGVYSKMPPYSSCIDHGRTGMLAGTEAGEWIDALEFLIDDAVGRRKIACAARGEVLRSSTLSCEAHLFREFYESLV